MVHINNEKGACKCENGIQGYAHVLYAIDYGFMGNVKIDNLLGFASHGFKN